MATEIDLYARQKRLAWFLIVPAVLVVLLVVGYPLILVVINSFQQVDVNGAEPSVFVGLENYTRIFQEPEFWNSVLITVIFSFFSVTIETALGLAIALIANSKFKGRTILRVAILVPWAIPTVVSSKIWQWMFNDQYGVINVILGGIDGVVSWIIPGLHLFPPHLAWLTIPQTALPVLVAVDIWKTTPFMSLLLLAGLQLIPKDLYEAASIDGATPVRKFWSVTFPLVLPTLLVALIFRTLDALRVFDIFYIMVGEQKGLETMATYNQEQLINNQEIGVASADSVFILIFIMAFVILYTRFSRTSFE